MGNNVFKVSSMGISVDYPIGQLLEIKGNVCEVVVDPGLSPCSLFCAGHGLCKSLACSGLERKDGMEVVFKMLNENYGQEQRGKSQ